MFHQDLCLRGGHPRHCDDISLAPQQLKGIGGIARFSPPDADALEKEHIMAFHSAKAGPMSIKKGFIFA